MKSLNTTDNPEAIAREECERLRDLTKVTVRVRASWHGPLLLPSKDGEIEVKAVFRTFTFGDNYVVERATMKHIPLGDTGQTMVASEPNEYRRLMLKKNLLDWSLPVPIEREDGWMTPESYDRVGNMPAPLIDALLDEFYRSTTISDEENKIIERQCAILFSEHSRGVSNACEAVSMFCTLGTFWEKFGLNKDMLPEVPFKEYMMLKMMTSKEGESMRQKTKSTASRHSGTKIAGAGGRTRPSRGKRIAL